MGFQSLYEASKIDRYQYYGINSNVSSKCKYRVTSKDLSFEAGYCHIHIESLGV